MPNRACSNLCSSAMRFFDIAVTRYFLFELLLNLFDRWRCPFAIESGGLGPVGAQEEREILVCRRGQPICALLGITRLVCLHIDCKRAIGAALQVLVLGSDRIALDRVGFEEMLFV